MILSVIPYDFSQINKLTSKFLVIWLARSVYHIFARVVVILIDCLLPFINETEYTHIRPVSRGADWKNEYIAGIFYHDLQSVVQLVWQWLSSDGESKNPVVVHFTGLGVSAGFQDTSEL